MKQILGNDIVDLEANRNDLVTNTRFHERIFTSNEQEMIFSSSQPNITIWKLWSAKESVYKVLSKIDYSFTLNFKILEINLEESICRFNSIICYLRWDITNTYIHCVARTSPHERYFETITQTNAINLNMNNFTKNELLFSNNSNSLKARLAAKKLIFDKYELENIEIYRQHLGDNNFLPPVIKTKHEVAEIDISLSHDNKFIAIVIS